MPKGLKIFLISLLILVSLVGTVFIYIYKNLDALKKYALKEVNVLLKSELSAKSIEVSFMQTFPKVSLALNEVTIEDPLRKGKYLLKASHLYLGFNFYDVLNEKYRINLLDLDSGELNLYSDASGRNNFDLLKETKDDGKKKPFSFELNKLKLSKVKLTYLDVASALNAKVYIASSEFSGKFKDTRFNLDILLKGDCELLQSGGISFLKNKAIEVETSLDVDNEKHKFQLIKGNFGVNQLALTLEGWVQSERKQTEYQLKFKAQKISIQDLLSTLPIKMPEAILAYQSNGNVFFEGEITGIQTATKNPRVQVQFGIVNGTMLEPDTKIKLEQINLKGSFDNGANGALKDVVISIPELSAVMVGSKIKGSLYLQNMVSPKLSMDLTGDANLQTLHAFFKFEDVKEIRGMLQFTLILKGEKKGNTWDWNSPFNKGIFALNMDKLSLNYLDKSLDHALIKAEITHNDLHIEEAHFNIGKSDLKLTGKISAFLDFLVQKNVTLKGNFQLVSQNLDASDLLIYNSSDPREPGEKPLDYVLNLSVQTALFTYETFKARAFKSNLILYPEKIVFKETSMNTSGGSFSGSGEFIMNDNQYILKSTNDAKGIQINELLTQFNNFGQKEFTSDNLFGLITAHSDMLIFWDGKFNLQADKMVVLTEMTVKNGELINYEPLNSLSKFVDVNELNNLKFSELKNTLTIQNKVLSIPTMDFKNNALNLSLTGAHTFENVVDYKVKLSLSELLSKRRKPQANEFGEEDEKTKGISLYLSITGPIDKLKFVFDRKGAKEQLKADVKKEKEVIKEILKQEFSIRKDTTLKKLEKKNDNNDELEFEEN
ncbi:MAG: AsmA-like C-terminal region-containing protein [bacterium]|nr:AsmA-like C-terminal region-containing protein [bacterium]